jgi:hypothetical protein
MSRKTLSGMQKHAFNPVLTLSREILYSKSRNFAKFSIHTHCECAQFSLICLKKSRSPRPTRARQTVASKRTFGGFSAPEKRTFRLTLLDLTKQLTPNAKMRSFGSFADADAVSFPHGEI